MVPGLGEIRQMEQLAASEDPTARGAWWIMLQTAESICNYASLRDPINNACIPEFWSQAAAGVETVLGQESARPLPYDDLMQMVSFCGDHLQAIAKSPRHNLVKTDKMVRPEKAREIGYKTINWLGKQPGKTVREKMAGRQKLLTQVKEYSYDIRENQVAMMLYRQIMRRVADRINHGTKTGAYDECSCPQIEQMLRIKKLLRESPLGSVAPKNHTQANNALLSDKHYSVIWRAYMDMYRFDMRQESRWKQGLALYVRAVFLAINAKLLSFNDVYVVEDRVKLNDAEDWKASYVVGYHSDIPYIAEVFLSPKRITIRIYNAPMNGMFEPKHRKELQITFTDAVSKEKLKAHRGTPISVEFREDGQRRSDLYYADFSCIRALSVLCAEKIFSFADIERTERTEDDFVRKGFAASAAFDIVGDGIRLGLSDHEMGSLDRFYSGSAVVYKNKDNTAAVYPGGCKSVHLQAEEQIAVRDAVLSEDSRGLKAALDEIYGKLTLNQDDYFFYLVPDALEELRQRDLKQCVKGCFARTFPVWRSVAALVPWLTDPEYEFAEDSVFVYMDLVGDTATAGMMTIHYEDALGNYTCNHFPPFPQIEEGDAITEDAFCASYVREYAKKRKISIQDEEVERLVREHAVRELMLKKSCANAFFHRDGRIVLFQITYDQEVVNRCALQWQEGIRKFWNKMQSRLGRNQVNYVCFISDLLTEADMRSVNIGWNKLSGIFRSTSEVLLKGALIYRDRLNNHLPIWTEYLPKLCLKIPIEGRYVDWDLIDENTAIDVMEEDTEFPVKEPRPLRLHAGAAEYHFDLKKEDISRRPSLMEAYIPLREELTQDVDVNLFVRYKYGYDNSYELILRPVNAKDAPFEEIVAQWRSGYREIKGIGGPKFPPLKSSEEIQNEVKRIGNSFMKTGNFLYRYLGYQYAFETVSEKSVIENACKFLTINTFKLREMLRYYERNKEVEEFADWFFNSDLYEICLDLMYLEGLKFVSEEFLEDYEDKDEMKNLRSSAMQLIYSFGAYVPDELQQYMVENYHDLDIKYKESILFNLLYMNTEHDAVWNLLLELFRNNLSGVIRYNVRNLSNLCWCDEAMIFKLGRYPALVREIVNASVNEMKRLGTITPKNESYAKFRKRYLAVIEVILAILRLREDPDFNILTAGTKEAKDLAELIRKVDVIMESPESRIKLLVDKPEALRNMSDIAYAIDMYLTGNEGVDSIEVLSVESDE